MLQSTLLPVWGVYLLLPLFKRHTIAHEDFPVGQDSDNGDLETVWAWEGDGLGFNKKFRCRKNKLKELIGCGYKERLYSSTVLVSDVSLSVSMKGKAVTCRHLLRAQVRCVPCLAAVDAHAAECPGGVRARSNTGSRHKTPLWR